MPPAEHDPPTVREGAVRHRPPAAALRTGAELAGRYRILGLLGEGGWGVVYHARDLTLELDVALKVLHPRIARDPAKLASFRNEVRVARMVTHPNVCRLHDLVDTTDGCFITMEYVAGESLAARLDRGNLALSRALHVLHDVANGLAAAHAAGVIHRDLKPSNVLLAGDRAVVADFGIAGERRALAAGPQSIVGTRGYMAPEQASGAPLDARVDVYALGVLAFVLTTGKRPPLIVTSTVIEQGEPLASPASQLAPQLATLPRDLAALIVDCLALDPAERPANAGAMLERIEHLVATRRRSPTSSWHGHALARGAASEGGPSFAPGTPTRELVVDHPTTVDPRLPRRPRRRAAGTLAIAIAIAAVVGLIAGWLSRTPATPRAASPPAAAPPVAIAVAPRIVIPAIDVHALPEDDRWLGPVVQRRLADELTDAWGLDVELGSSAQPAPNTLALPTQLARDPSGRLRLAIDHGLTEATSATELAIAAAARIVGGHVPEAARHPTAAELTSVGAHDVEAWRLWRRAEHETLLARWDRAIELCKQALARDPEFPVASLELALAFDTRDSASAIELAHAEELMKRVPVGELWHLAVTGAHQLRAGNLLGAALTASQVLSLPLTPRERLWIELRWVTARYILGEPPERLAPSLVRIAEAHPDSPGAFKLLGDIHLSSESKTAPTLALRYASRAVELAPEDTGARVMFAMALLLDGRRDEARVQAAVLARIDPDEKRVTQDRLFALHMALGEIVEAELDAQRLLDGTLGQRTDGAASLALLDLYWGRFARGVHGLTTVADLRDSVGATVSAARRHYQAGRQAWLLGDTATARAEFDRVAAGSTRQAGSARVLASILAGKLDEARAHAAELAADSVERAAAELAIADAAHDPAGVLTSFARIEKLSTTIEHLFPAAEALERTGRIDEATAMFERLANPVFAWSEPIASTRAWIRIGRLRERAGNRDAARDAYAEVIHRWGDATTRTPEVDEARARLRALAR